MQPSDTLPRGSGVDRSLVVIGAYALLALFLVPVYAHFPSPNEFTRWLLDASIVERRTIEVSAFAPLLGPRFEDLAVAGGRTYSNKAPGLALIALPGYLAARPLVGPPSPAAMRGSLTAMRLMGSTLPLVLLAFLFRHAARKAGADQDAIAFAVAALLFALPTFTYGLLLFSHSLVGAALFGAWWLLFGRRADSMAGDVAAGALIGVAVLSEYPAVFPAAVLVIGKLAAREWRRSAAVALGGIPFALILGGYQKLAFGSPLALPSSHEKYPGFRELGQSGVGGVGLPSPAILVEILAHPARGLLIFSPVLVAAVLGFRTARHRLTAPAWWSLVLVPVVIVLFYAGYPNWHGGWNVSVRYAVPALPFLAFPLCLRAPSRWMAVLFGASVAAVVLSTIAFPFVPLEFPLPWGTLALPLLSRGAMSPTLVGAGLPALVVVVAVVAVACGAAVPRRQIALVAAGILIAVGAGLVAQWATGGDLRQRVERGYIEDVYFEHRGALERAMPTGMAVPRGLAQRRAYEQQIPPPAR